MQHAFGQLVLAREEALADRGRVQAQQCARVLRQVPDDDLVLVLRVRRQRPHHGQAAALHRVAARQVHERPADADLVEHRFLAPQLQAEVPQLRLLVLDQPRQRDGGAHVRQRIVRGLVRQAVGGGEVLQPEAGAAAIGPLGPGDAFGAQRPGGAHQVEEVPAAAAVLPLAGVGVDQVAPEQVAGEFVVKPDGVVAHTDGAGLGQQALDAGGKRGLGLALGQAFLRGDAGDQAGVGVGQVVGSGLAIGHHRLADFIQLGVGADGRKLGRPVAPHVGAKGFVVVPDEGVRGGGLGLWVGWNHGSGAVARLL